MADMAEKIGELKGKAIHPHEESGPARSPRMV